jgi:uncharacterized protein
LLKKLLLFFTILLFAVTPVSAADLEFPSYTGFVNDFEGIITNKDELEQKLVAFEKETGVEIAVITVSNFQDVTIEEFAVKLFEKWRIGKEKQDNGLLIIVSSAQRKSRFEVGYGLEGTLPDGLTGRIQDEFMIPSFKENDYSAGITKGVDETIAIIKKDPFAISVNDTQPESSSDAPEWIFSIIIFGIYIMAATKSWWFGGVFGGFLGLIWAFSSGVWFLPIFFALLGLLIDFILSQTIVGKALIAMSHSVGSSSGGFGGGGRSGGGGVSFGGGSSGGGGSSRSW